jgi:hypothetical protein
VSYDLYLWASPDLVDTADAGVICQRLADDDQSATASDPRLLEFAAELRTVYPPFEEATDGSPWNMSPDITDRRVILCLGWSHVSTAVPGSSNSRTDTAWSATTPRRPASTSPPRLKGHCAWSRATAASSPTPLTPRSTGSCAVSTP